MTDDPAQHQTPSNRTRPGSGADEKPAGRPHPAGKRTDPKHRDRKHRDQERPGHARAGRHPAAKAGPSADPAAEATVFGLHSAAYALANPARRITRIFATENAQRRLAEALAPHTERIETTRPRDLDRRLGPDTVHQGVLLEVEPLATEDLAATARRAHDTGFPVLLLDQVTDPHNVGAVLRSAAVFGAAGLVMTQRHSPPLGGALAKAASGALELTPIALVRNLAEAIAELKAEGLAVLGLDGTGDVILDEAVAALAGRPLALALGAEGSGLRALTRERCDRLCRIGGDGPISSLNVSNAAAVALHVAAAQRRAT
jgi:23S rRNA (guanosine2251-2'-O)-methyltransferase